MKNLTGEAIERINELENKLLPNEYINKIVDLFFSAEEYYLNHNRTAFEEVEEYLFFLPDAKWAPYYFVTKGEFGDNNGVNQEMEEVINIYFSLIKTFSELTVKFADGLIDAKGNRKKYYEDLLLLRKALQAFEPKSMVIGLLDDFSHETFREDISLMRLVKSYFDTGKVNKWEIQKLNGYKRLYPWVKVEVFQKLEAMLNEEKNNSLKQM